MLIVRLLKDIRVEMLFMPTLCLCRGELVEAQRHPHGEVSAKLRSGGSLGMGPDEFEVVADGSELARVQDGYRELAERLYHIFRIAIVQLNGTVDAKPYRQSGWHQEVEAFLLGQTPSPDPKRDE